MKIEVYTFSAIIQLVFVKDLLSSQETIAEGKISMPSIQWNRNVII